MYDYQESRKVGTAGRYSVWELKQDHGGRTHTVWGPDIHGRECRIGAHRGSYSAFQSMRMLHLAALKKDLKYAEAERNRQYWAFTRTASGKPVSPAITRLVVKLETEIKAMEER